MKNNTWRAVSLAYLIAALSMMGCTNISNSAVSASGGRVKATFVLGGTASKTVYSEGSSGIASYTLTLTSVSDGSSASASTTGSALSLSNLLVGSYTAKVVAYNASSQEVAEGSKDITLTSSGSNTFTIALSWLASGEGAVSIALSWPTSVGITRLAVATASGAEAYGSETNLTVTSGDSTDSSTFSQGDAAYGSERVRFRFYKSDVLEATVSEAVQVLANLSSGATISLSASDFAEAPSAASNFGITFTTSTVDFSWTLPKPNTAVNWELLRKASDDSSYSIVTSSIDATATSYSDTTATWGKTYSYELVGVNTHGESSATTASCILSLTGTSVSSSGMQMVAVLGGTFSMGATGVAEPVHQVTVSSFFMGSNEVTQAQYKVIMGTNPASGAGYGEGDDYPVYFVDYFKVAAFCNALSEKEGLQSVYTIGDSDISMDITKSGYRLPTEAEWEYAAKGGSLSQGYTYAGSNTVDDVAWYSGNSGGVTHPVGQKQANELGLYDMSGNAWDLCWDWLGDYSSNTQTDPTGPDSGTAKVLRGGSWLWGSSGVTVTNRNSINIACTTTYGDIGFRVVRRGSTISFTTPTTTQETVAFSSTPTTIAISSSVTISCSNDDVDSYSWEASPNIGGVDGVTASAITVDGSKLTIGNKYAIFCRITKDSVVYSGSFSFTALASE